MRAGLGVMIAAGLALSALPAQAAVAFDGRVLGLWWVLPFLGILLSIALCPLLTPGLWHRHFGKIAAFWALAFLVPFALLHGLAPAWNEAAHMVLLDYVPFMALILALYATSGGVLLAGTLRGTPAANTLMLAIATLVASLTGTTGASMLFVRPMLRANAGRTRQVHIFVFFIFLAANIGN